MKKIIILFIGVFFSFFAFTSCDYDGIDPITEVDPGPDAGSPEINVLFPNEGATIQVPEPIASIDIEFEVVDDIEVEMVEVFINGNLIATFDQFTDYRVVKEQVSFHEVVNGEHTLTIKATDISGNTSTKTVNFSKEPPYTPKYEGEFLYMPFDGDYMDLVRIVSAEEIGSPGFSSQSFFGSSAYEGQADSYLTIPLDQENLSGEFSAAFWYKVSGEPDRAGILVAGDDADDRNQGFRLFREGSATEQRIKLNVGTGSGESWNDGGVIDVTEGEWVHVAFSVSPEQTVIFLNGMPVNTGTMASPIDWTGVEELTIASGGETFSYWGHLSDNSLIDELRLFDTAMSQEDVQMLINASAVTLHMPFNGDYKDLIANREVTVVGSPGFAGESVEGTNAYAGAEGSYLLLPSEGLMSQEISATFWYKVNADPDRAGIITIGPPDEENAGFPDVQNKRSSGFRLFREGNATEQRIKLNVGTGSGDAWNDGGVIDVTAGEWVHVAFTISASESVIYINGEPVNTGALPNPIDWSDTDVISIMSGAPRFTEWNHLSDQSYMDDLRIYNKVLSQEEINSEMNN